MLEIYSKSKRINAGLSFEDFLKAIYLITEYIIPSKEIPME